MTADPLDDEHDVMLLRVDDVCRKLSLCRATVYKLIRVGELRANMIAGRRLIPAADVRALVASSLVPLGSSPRPGGDSRVRAARPARPKPARRVRMSDLSPEEQYVLTKEAGRAGGLKSQAARRARKLAMDGDADGDR